MSRVADHGHDGSPWLERVVHHSVPLLLLAWISGLSSSTLAGYASTLVLAVVVGALFWHSRSICLTCARQVGRMASPAATAERNRPLLWLEHLVTERHTSWAVLAATAAGALVTRLVLSTGLPHALCLAVLGAWVVLLTRATLVHGQVQPWCPYCRDGGGGEGASTPAPQPSVEAS